ncbi:unnamed protein product [Moneuplotes crassus]|uniref:Uncharacterized protein n=1 Tax=Euplotes crassus TaxID=5936 RepID=A0AAD1Y4S8_EUPCR|nr:unnamed protein product [Moneuplotes crassus]
MGRKKRGGLRGNHANYTLIPSTVEYSAMKLRELAQENEKLKNAMRDREKVEEGYKNVISQYKTALKQKDHNLEVYRTQLTKLRQENSEMKDICIHNQNKEEDITKALQKVDELKNERDSLHENLEEYKKQKKELEELNNSIRDKCKEDKNKYKAKKKEIIKKYNEKLEEEKKELLAEIEEYKEKIHKLSSEDSQKRISKLKERNHKIRKELDEVIQDFEKQKEEYSQLKKKYSQLEEMLEQAQQEPEITLEEYNDLALKYKTLKKDYKKLKNLASPSPVIKAEDEEAKDFNHKDQKKAKKNSKVEENNAYEIDISKYKLDYPSDDSRGFNQATKSQDSITHLSKSINLKFPKESKEPRKPKQNIIQKPPTPNAPKVAKKVRKPKNRL